MDQQKFDQLASDWQDTIDIMAQIIGVPAGLIMRLTEGELEVFVSSKTQGNPYKVGEKEVMASSGLYCETVINTNQMLKVPNALKDENWKSNPDVKLNMISYLGLPIMWPNGKPFGTICILDKKENHYNSQYESLIKNFKTLIEKHLEMIEKAEILQKLAEIDLLTNIYNRRSFLVKAEAELNRAIRYNHPLSIVLLDIDYFKKINDNFGHQAGDKILKSLATSVASLVRFCDIFGRYGGEEFIIMLVETDYRSATIFAERIRNTIANLIVTYDSILIKFTVSIGIGILENDQELSSIIKRADNALYEAKNKGRNCVC